MWLRTSRADAPPDGYRQRSWNIAAIASPTANAPASAGSRIASTHAVPTMAETVLQPITAQGGASGLAGMANTSTALPPIGATSQGLRPAASAIQRQSTLATKTPMEAQANARRRSLPRFQRTLERDRRIDPQDLGNRFTYIAIPV